MENALFSQSLEMLFSALCTLHIFKAKWRRKTKNKLKKWNSNESENHESERTDLVDWSSFVLLTNPHLTLRTPPHYTVNYFPKTFIVIIYVIEHSEMYSSIPDIKRTVSSMTFPQMKTPDESADKALQENKRFIHEKSRWQLKQILVFA